MRRENGICIPEITLSRLRSFHCRQLPETSMTSEKNSASEAACRLRMENEMTIYHAVELKQTLLAALEKPHSLEIDLSAVTEIDSAGIQLLISAKESAKLQRKDMHLVGHSAAVIEAFELLKLVGYFGDPLIIPSPLQSGTGRFSSN